MLNNTLELVMDEAVNDWWLDERSSKEEKMLTIRKPTEAFVKWLAEAESESESESGDDQSDDEEEEGMMSKWSHGSFGLAWPLTNTALLCCVLLHSAGYNRS